MKSYIHGENILVPISEIPNGERTQEKTYIVGHSETGHHHVLEGEFDVIKAFDELFLEVQKPSQLTHKKSFDVHQTLTIEPGTYKVVRAVEYNPFTKALQNVWD